MKFSEQVYDLCKKIPRGKVTTYKEIGLALGGKGKVYRAVGVALKNNPYAPEVPCHRVIKSNSDVGGFRGKLQNKGKISLLRAEGVVISQNKVDLNKYLHKFKK